MEFGKSNNGQKENQQSESWGRAGTDLIDAYLGEYDLTSGTIMYEDLAMFGVTDAMIQRRKEYLKSQPGYQSD